MLRLFKNFKKKDFIYVLICIILMVFQVWIELRLPEYMSKITMLIETDGSSFNEIIHQGIFMLICAFGSMVSAMTIGYFASRLSANFSLRLRESLFKKVQKLCTAEIKQFSTSSLITRTTNDVTQIEMLIAMGLQAMIKAPIMAVWAISKIVNKSTNLSLIVGAGVLVLLTIIIIIMVRVVPKFSKIQKFTDSVNSVTR